MTLGLIGKGLVFLAVAAFLASGILTLLKKPAPGKWAFYLGCLGIFGAFASLATLFATEQFQYEYVFGHSAKDLPIAYRVAAVWSGQQGSFLLWAVTSALFALVVMPFTGKYRRWFSTVYAFFLASLAAILAYETPYNLIKEAIVDKGHVMRPPSGNGLTPALQNYWVIIHPPTIFLGFGSLTVMFAWAIAAMLERDGKTWIPQVRPWAILSSAILGLGLCMGGFWAYETLGWGGFWAWDPVENVSFVPWIFTIAFYHGIMVQAARNRWIATNLLMGGIPFVLFTFGTLMTRSGLLGDTSVHSFAEMNRFALWILAGILFVSLALLFGAWLGRGLKLGRESAPRKEGLDRESAFSSGVLLLTLTGTAAALGMAWSFISALVLGRAHVIEAHTYQVALVWLFIPILLLVAIAPFMGWRKQSASELSGRFLNAFGLSLGVTGLCLWLFKSPLWGAGTAGQTKPSLEDGSPVFQAATVDLFGLHLPPLWAITGLVFLASFAAFANLWRIGEVFRRSKMSIGGFVSHTGVAILMAGLIISRGLEHHEVAVVPKDHPTKVLDYELAYDGMTKKDLFDRDNTVKMKMSGPGDSYTATPGLYYLENPDSSDKAMVWPHIHHHPLYDVYLSVGAPTLYANEKPMILKRGESAPLGQANVKFVDWHAPADPRSADAKWTADLVLTYKDQSFKVAAEMVRTETGMSPTLTKINNDLYVAMLGMNAEDGSITLQWPLVEPRFPVELFYKPMTFLVWLGAGILFLGGTLSALYRRNRQPSTAKVVEPTVEDAPLTAA